MAAVLVSYPADPGARFDRDYYLGTHMPLVQDALGPLGLIHAIALFPDDADQALLAAALLTFRDAAARDAALASPAAAPVFADIPNFTNVQPAAARMSVA